MWRGLVMLLVAGLVGSASDRNALAVDDDLTVVRKAVSEEAQLPATATETAKPNPSGKNHGRPAQWLKIRVIEHRSEKARVTIKLPLDLARSLEDLPVDCHRADRHAQPCPVKLAELLAALESGTEIMDIEDDDATVRVWLE